jgi:hypothetical protein
MTYLQKQAENKSKTLSKLLGVSLAEELNKASSSSPNIEIIRKMKDRAQTDNPMLRLSISNYELMCKDDRMLEITATLLEVNKEKLRKVCKYLAVFKENINSSPETIKGKMRAVAAKAPILKLPYDMRKKIVAVFEGILEKKYILRRGIPFDKLEKDTLSSNINAIDFLIEMPHLISWSNLSGNPKAIKLLEEKYKEESKLSKEELASVPRDNKIDWRTLSGNPEATELIKAKYSEEQLSPEETAALPLFDKLDWRVLSSNPCAMDILKLPVNRFKIDWVQLSSNYNPEAEELLRAPENIQGTTWNPKPVWNAVKLNHDPIDLQGKTAEQDDIGYVNSKIRGWSNLSLDPAAIKLLIKRIAHEEALPADILKKIVRINKINWNFITKNPAIFI